MPPIPPNKAPIKVGIYKTFVLNFNIAGKLKKNIKQINILGLEIFNILSILSQIE
jgi:hypothetical protein